MPMPQITAQVEGFSQKEKLQIQAKNFYEFGKKLGVHVRDIARTTKTQLLTGENVSLNLQLAQQHLSELEKLSHNSVFYLDGQNWLSNYLQLLRGYSRGTGIAEVEVALMQMELAAGCQTVIIQDNKTHAVQVIHSEEDPAYSSPDRSDYPYRFISAEINTDLKVDFLLYPGLCSWGAAYGINRTNGLLQTVDDLWISESTGPIWANFLAFVTLGCGKIDSIKELVSRLSKLKKGYWNGYAIHLVQALNEPEIFSFEFGGDVVSEQTLVEEKKITYVAQPNIPLTKELVSFSDMSLPDDVVGQQSRVQSCFEMKERKKRLDEIAHEFQEEQMSSQESINKGLWALADPRADAILVFRPTGPQLVFSCLPSIWTISHLSAYISNNKIEYYAGKLTPAPRKGSEYSLVFNKKHPYLDKNLWDLADSYIKDHE